MTLMSIDMSLNRLQQLHDAGQSIWLDYIERPMVHNGELERMIREDALTGMTSNPTIFEKALAEGDAYDAQIAASSTDQTAGELFEAIETEDVRAACDRFRPVYDAADGADGLVSIEVSPGVAHDADATMEEARRLWHTVNRPNVMIKVPGTAEGARAIRQLIAEGINVNVTLLFSIDAYQRVIEAYQAGIGERVWAKQPVRRIASVASFFVSRVDTAVDRRLDALIAGQPAARARLAALKGKAAIANAALAYALFSEMFDGGNWRALADAGARVQRPLWASTSTKNPAYRDVMYVEGLIGPHTVNTMPVATLAAFRDHGEVRRTVDADVGGARNVVADLAAVGIDLHQVTDALLVEGIASFQKSFDELIAGLTAKSAALGHALAVR